MKSVINLVSKSENICLKTYKMRCVSVISLITDKRMDITKPSILSIKDRQVIAQYGN